MSLLLLWQLCLQLSQLLQVYCLPFLVVVIQSDVYPTQSGGSAPASLWLPLLLLAVALARMFPGHDCFQISNLESSDTSSFLLKATKSSRCRHINAMRR